MTDQSTHSPEAQNPRPKGKSLPDIVEARAPEAAPPKARFFCPCTALIGKLIANWRANDAEVPDAPRMDRTLCVIGITVVMLAGVGYFGLL